VLSDWRQSVTQAFLDAYREAARGVGSVPEDPDALDALIRLFVIEKALYEVRYELNNRPDWLGVPLAGLAELLPPASP
jgi:maltose alpha-D-glucosyltransferase/alpha-amylase